MACSNQTPDRLLDKEDIRPCFYVVVGISVSYTASIAKEGHVQACKLIKAPATCTKALYKGLGVGYWAQREVGGGGRREGLEEEGGGEVGGGRGGGGRRERERVKSLTDGSGVGYGVMWYVMM